MSNISINELFEANTFSITIAEKTYKFNELTVKQMGLVDQITVGFSDMGKNPAGIVKPLKDFVLSGLISGDASELERMVDMLPISKLPKFFESFLGLAVSTVKTENPQKTEEKNHEPQPSSSE